MEYAKHVMRGDSVDEAWLEVYESNPTAVCFDAALGYSIGESDVSGDWGELVTTLVMTKKL